MSLSPAATWSTIADWEPGEQLSLWGWQLGISTADWVALDGAPGWQGVTLHADLDNNGAVDISVTWSGKAQNQLPAPHDFAGLRWFV